jgi:hypothetical protein
MLTLNGEGVVSAALSFPRTGIWHADMIVDSPTEITGRVAIDVEGRLALSGTVERGGIWQDADYLRVVGGAGGLRLTAKAKHYTSTSVRIVLGDLLASVGERLSSKSDAGLLRRTVAAWTTAAIPVGRLITQLLLSVDPNSTWRVLSDGTVWAGPETWPDSGIVDSDFQILSEDPARAEAILGVEAPILMPGTTLGGRRVSYVEHRVGNPETRTSVWFETGAGEDRLKRAIRGAVKAAQSPIDYFSHYFADVISQNGNKIDVRPKDARIPSMASVPLFGGFPKWELRIKTGGRVLIGWSGGDPSQPYALGFDSDVAAGFVGVLADAVTIGPTATAQPSMLGQKYRTQEDVMLTAWSTAMGTAATACAAAASPATTQAGVIAVGVALAAMSTAIASFQALATQYLSQQVRNS